MSFENSTDSITPMKIRHGVRTIASGSHIHFPPSPSETMTSGLGNHKSIMDEMIDGENAVAPVEQLQPLRANNSTGVIELLRAPGHVFHMQKLNFQLQKICRKFPPAKNENKFIYGKLAEKAIIDTIQMCNGLSAIDLDKTHTVGSEYKNDVNITHHSTSTTHPYSIKVSKSGGKITLINCRNTNKHNVDGLSMIVGHIQLERIYIFDHGHDFERFLTADGASVDYKQSIFTYLKTCPQYTVQLPPLSEQQKEIIEGVNEVNPYDYLYNEFIANADTDA